MEGKFKLTIVETDPLTISMEEIGITPNVKHLLSRKAIMEVLPIFSASEGVYKGVSKTFDLTTAPAIKQHK